MVSKASQLLSLEQTTSQLSDFHPSSSFLFKDFCKTISDEFRGNFQTLYMCVFHKSLCGMLGSERRFHVMCL